MGHQIIKQPDGLLAVWSTGTDSWILYDATPEELVKYYVDRDAERTRRQILDLTDLVLADKPREVYYQFAMTFEEAQAQHLEGGHDPVPFAHLRPTDDRGPMCELDEPELSIGDFLLERYAEDEAIARAATQGPWTSEVGGSEGYYLFGPRGIDERMPERRRRIAAVTWGSFEDDKANAAHMAHNDPETVLADLAAKRKIVELHQGWPVLRSSPPTIEPAEGDGTGYVVRATQRIQWVTQEEYRARFGEEPPTAPMLLALVQPYAGHPDFREEWRQ